MFLCNVDSTPGPGVPQGMGVSGDYQMAELETENARLKQLVAELLIKNHELRQMHLRSEWISE